RSTIMDLEFELHTSDPSFLSRLMERTEVYEDDQVELADEIRLRYLNQESLRDFSQMEVITLLLSFATGVASNVVANLVYQRIKKNDEKQDIKLIVYIPSYRRGQQLDLSSPSSIQKVIDTMNLEKKTDKKDEG